MLLIKEGNTFNIPIETFLCDTDADFANVPSNAPSGSIAYILDSNGETIKKVKNSSGNWVEADILGNYPTNFTEPITVLTPTTDYNPATKKYVDDAIGGITSFDYEIVNVLPGTGTKGVIYLIPRTPETSNIYDEYIWITNNFEKIGSTDIDLSGYIQKVSGIDINGKIPKLLADGSLVSSGYTLKKSVPENAVFTDTTYNNATTSTAGLMSAEDKNKLDNLGDVYLKKTDLVTITEQAYEALQEKTAPYYFIIEE